MSISTTSTIDSPPHNPRLQAMLHAPIAATVLRLGWPNLLMVMAQSATGLIETWYLAKLGTDVLAGLAVVFPVLMLMQNMSQGAMGGGISSAVARALGAGKHKEASDLVRHAVLINGAIGLVFMVLVLALGPWLYRMLGVEGAALRAALDYSNVIFSGLILMWVMNALASVIRGTGNMIVPGAVICGGAVLLIPISPCLIFGLGPFPALGVIGGACALLVYYTAGVLILGWYCLSGRNAARFTWGQVRWQPMRNILVVGGVASFNSVLTNTLIASTGALVAHYAGTTALAGYGTAARLEYFVLPIAFGFGAPMVALVSSNIGAGQPERARRIALVGSAMAFALAESVGLAAAIWPYAWLRLFGAEAHLLETGAAYLRTVGPFYGFFALGFSLYFASQGAGKLKWPLLAGVLRITICVAVGWIVLATTGSLIAFFATSAVGMIAYGTLVYWSVAAGTWFSGRAPRR
jgi:putative MATE family efflux protein